MRVEIKKAYKSITKVQEFELPDFVVLTGKNGSGKSHLMELMARNLDCLVFDDKGNQLQRVKYIPFGGLNPQVEEKCEMIGLANKRRQAWNNVEQMLNRFRDFKLNNGWNIEKYLNSDSNRKNVLGKLVELAEGDADAITEEFFYEHDQLTNNDILYGQIASIFKLYQIHLTKNNLKALSDKNKEQKHGALSEEEFKNVYGPKPWELINDMLLRAGLTYQVNHPEEIDFDVDFKLHLSDIITGIEIHVNDLSTGEMVLMSLALSIYNANETTAKPDLLLLDEPDAALHPEFSKILMDAIEESLVNKSGVRVILSTHSPVTVALAPKENIYMMDKQQSKPVKISKQQAVNLLTKDLDNIRLSYEKRRQVFVESKYDAQYYSRIISLISKELPTVPQFLPPRSGSGSNSYEVSLMVNALREKGNDLVYGIRDFDNKKKSSECVFVLGDGNRYAIENYVFDPIYVAFLLIREGIITTENMGVSNFGFTQLRKLTDDEIQKMADYIIKELGFPEEKRVKYEVQCGKTFEAAYSYFLCNGHELEVKIKEKWPKLKEIARKGDNALKNHVLDRVCGEYPEYISTDFVDLFMNIV